MIDVLPRHGCEVVIASCRPRGQTAHLIGQKTYARYSSRTKCTAAGCGHVGHGGGGRHCSCTWAWGRGADRCSWLWEGREAEHCSRLWEDRVGEHCSCLWAVGRALQLAVCKGEGAGHCSWLRAWGGVGVDRTLQLAVGKGRGAGCVCWRRYKTRILAPCQRVREPPRWPEEWGGGGSISLHFDWKTWADAPTPVLAWYPRSKTKRASHD